MQNTDSLTLTAANDNPGGPATTTIALDGLIALLAQAEARHSAAVAGPSRKGRYSDARATTRKGARQ
jgi:hypothetical protein